MPEILIDVTRLLGRFMKGRLPTGVDRVCQAYIHRYGGYARVLLHWGGYGWSLSPRASQELFSLLMNPTGNFSRSALRIIAGSPPRPLPDQSKSARFLFNIGHSGLERSGYAAWIARKKLRPLFMVHDLIPITHHEYCRPGELQRHEARMDAVLRAAAAIVANSQATLDELKTFAESRNLSLPASVVAHLASGLTPPDHQLPPLNSAPYFVMLGTIEPRKNHLMILHIWRNLVERMGTDAVPHLVIIGQRGWECENAVDLLERCEALKGMVTELPVCSDAELACWLGNARALLFPSMTEGYGLPLVEALALGTPVIASDLPVFHEIAGDTPEYLDPLDGMGWQARIQEYSRADSSARDAQLERIQHFSSPTWKQHFAAVDNLLEGIV
jgi:glycosyltransferase involved in cell wall biosynthesis